MRDHYKKIIRFLLSVNFAVVPISPNNRNLLHSLCRHEYFLCCQGNLGAGYINKSNLTIKSLPFYACY